MDFATGINKLGSIVGSVNSKIGFYSGSGQGFLKELSND